MQRFSNTMHMQGSNYGRGFGGQPQPQRQGGRRGRGNFRGNGNSRFEQRPEQRSGPGPNNQRPPENKSVIVIDDDSKQNNQASQKPQQQQPQKPQQQQPQKPQQQQPQKPQQPQQSPKPLQQQQTQKPPQQQSQAPKPEPAKTQQQPPQQKTVPQNQGKPQQNQVSTPQKPDKPITNENNQGTKRDFNSEPKQQQLPTLMSQNGNFAANKQGGVWAHGNRQGGGSFGQGNQGNRQSSGSFGQGNNQGEQGNQGNQGKQFGGPGGPARNQRNFQRGPQQGGFNEGGPGGPKSGGMREEQMLAHKLKELVGPLNDLPHMVQEEMMFNGRSRLYIGNISNELKEEDILAMFAPYGQTAELFLNKEKNFGFIKLDYRANAEKAKRELDGKMMSGRTLRVRFAPHNSAVRVKNIPPFVSNELLHRAFEIFGKIERAYVKVDERGKSLREGVVEFARKPSALAAIRNCTEKCFFLTSSLRPVIVESFEEPDELDGYQEKNLPKKHPEFLRSREVGPRFSEAGSFEHEYGTRWKQLHEMHRKKEETLKAELTAEEEKLEAQMEYAKYEHETELLRAQLRQREQDRERQKRSWEMAERAADERREQDRVALQRQGDELAARMRQQDDELRRRQKENTLFVQAQRLGSLLDRAESGYENNQQPMDGGFREQYDRGVGYDDNLRQQKHGWEGPRQVDDYPNKRRRY